jgi:hypothetical protein
VYSGDVLQVDIDVSLKLCRQHNGTEDGVWMTNTGMYILLNFEKKFHNIVVLFQTRRYLSKSCIPGNCFSTTNSF